MHRRGFLTGLAASGLIATTGVRAAAAGAPSGGETATWTTGAKYGVGTVADHGSDDPSRVWFTLTEGALTEVRFPRIDLLNVRTLEFVVADPDAGYAARSHDEDRTEEGTVERSVEPVDDDALLFEQTIEETASGRGWTLTAEYVAAPGRDALLADVSFEAHDGRRYDVYAVLDSALSQSGAADAAAVRGSAAGGERASGRGAARGKGKAKGHGKRKEHGRRGGDGSSKGRGDGFVLTARDTDANDDDAVILDEEGNPYDVACAMVADRGFDWATVDVVGGDSLSPLLHSGDASATYDAADGNVALAGRLGRGVRRLDDTVSLGFAEEADEGAATREATGALHPGFGRTRAKYRDSWGEYLREIDVPESVGSSEGGGGDLLGQYRIAAMALKAADSKQFPGAGIASPSVPWGDATEASDPSDYGYNFVWSRDLYQAFTAMLAMGDVDGALDAAEYIYEYQQDEEGFVPQNTFVDGRTRWGGEQMDNVSWPQVMAYQLKERHGIGFEEADYDLSNVKASADYVAANGPHSDQERWEEEAGYSPSTVAAEIAGLACAASLASDEGDDTDALVYLALADHWQANAEEWMATTSPPALAEPDEIDASYDIDYTAADTPYYVRVNDDRDPNDGAPLDINNGGPALDERAVIDAGFLELVRLGVKPPDDEVVGNSLALVDDAIRVETPNGPAWYRYTEDGYGEQGRDDGDGLPAGAPWGEDGDNGGRGRLWPIFSGERGEYELLAGDLDDDTDGDGADRSADADLSPTRLLESMHRFANSGYMIPEQVWDRPEPTAYGWEFGEGTGSATPLSWSMAQFVRLAWGIDAGEPVETPRFVRERYVETDVPEGPSLSVTFPADTLKTETATVSGTTDGAVVVVSTAAETVRADAEGGAFEVDVALPDGDADIRVVAATDGAAGGELADVGTTVRTKTVNVVALGERVAVFDDATGDDHGPGSYTYPSNDAFVDGAFDIDTFGVYETANRYQFLYSLAGPLTNPFGGAAGFSLQALQVYLRDPSAGGGSTEAREGVYATFAEPYQRRVVAEGFTGEFSPRVEAADGSVVSGDVGVTAYPGIDAIKLDVPKSAVGDLGAMQFVPLLLGQDGFGAGRIRPVDASNGGYVFGGGRDDATDSNVIDLVTPAGASQAEALDYSGTRRAAIPYLSL